MPAADPWPLLTVARLAQRDGGRCVHCGATEGLGVQHRAGKGMGGSRGLRLAERPSNGVILCNLLNAALEQDAALAAWAEQCGWKLPRYADPAGRPFWDQPAQQWVQPHDDWTRTPEAVIH